MRTGNWERRWHPLLQEWVIIAANTSERPWSGEVIKTQKDESPEFDPDCYLCPGVTRASGITNPHYTKPYAFTNDFASFSFDAPDVATVDNPFEKRASVHGTCKVVCFSPKHNITLAEMSKDELLDVVKLWQEEFASLSSHPKIENVLIFENKGKVIGVSNSHPHGQIYATGFVPKILNRERESFVSYFREHSSELMKDLVEFEINKKERIIYKNDHFVAFIPFFARFVYETYIVPLRHLCNITEFTKDELEAYVDIHHTIIVKFDNLYKMSFPNITMLHNAPCDNNGANKLFCFHTEFYPPLRSPDKLKYLAGFESGGGNIINPVCPEEAASRMREADLVHYKKQS